MTTPGAIPLGAVAIALNLCGLTGVIGYGIGIAARTEASREMAEAHDSLDAELRVACARGVSAGFAWRGLAEKKAKHLTGGRVWVTTLDEGE